MSEHEVAGWQPGDRLIHDSNTDLGPGRVLAVEERTLVVEFPHARQRLRLAVDNDALRRVRLTVGDKARWMATGAVVEIAELGDDGRVVLGDGTEVDENELWPLELAGGLVERLASGDAGGAGSFETRLDALRLASIREADGLGSFLGGRIRLFPHQLYVAERATRRDPVRWLLADEVGLGKTVESCLILNHLLRTGRAAQTLVVAPATLTVQWLGELWRKYHQVFVLLDEKRLEDVSRDFGEGFNPFDVYDRVVVSLELLVSTPRLTEQAVEAGIDLLVVDEAHHLRRPPSHPGNPAYRAIEPIAASGCHLLLLTAVPLEDDAHGFFRLLQLLLPREFSDFEQFERNLESGRRLPECTSATRRLDIGGLPPRRPVEVRLDEASWRPREELVERLRGRRAERPMAFRDKAALVRAVLSFPGPLAGLESRLAARGWELDAEAAAAPDPRVEWLVEQLPRWLAAREKVLVFVHDREALQALRELLKRRSTARIGIFHEELSTKQRDIEVAQFRMDDGPPMMISTEAGGEGRNFEFCARVVLFDLPWNPMLVEQRIGRLDRIGRDRDTEIVYFAPEGAGLASTVVGLYRRLGVFEHPLTSIETELRSVERAIERYALREPSEPGVADAGEGDPFEQILAEAERAYDRVERAAFHELHRDPYRPELAAEILARVPPELEALTRDVVLGACRAFRLQVEESRAGARHWIELDARARIESVPGVGSEGSFLGTFFREVAVEDETIDFFASGHPLVEGLIAVLEESSVGRVCLLDLREDPTARGQPGIAAIYREGTSYRVEVRDARGRPRPEWRERIDRRPLAAHPLRRRQWTEQPAWPQLVSRLAAHLPAGEEPEAIAVFRID